MNSAPIQREALVALNQVLSKRLKQFKKAIKTSNSNFSVFTATYGELTADTVIGTDIVIFKDYKLSIDLKLKSNPSSVRNNVFQFRSPHAATKIGSKGDRIPGIFQKANSNRLIAYNFINGKDEDFEFDARTDEWFNLKFEQVFFTVNWL